LTAIDLHESTLATGFVGMRCSIPWWGRLPLILAEKQCKMLLAEKQPET
jgi:hypothetical protein